MVPSFELNIVPHTLAETTMGDFQAGRQVNLEVDLIARYLERLLLGDEAHSRAKGVTRELLQRADLRGNDSVDYAAHQASLVAVK